MFVDYCTKLGPIVPIVKHVINIIQWGIPVVLVIFGMIDLGKAVMAGKEDEMKKAQGTLIKRVIYAVLIFLVVTIVSFVLGLLADTSNDAEGTGNGTGYNEGWITCFFGNNN